MINNVLKYWYTLESLQPSWPVEEKKDKKISENSLPWDGFNATSGIQVH